MSTNRFLPGPRPVPVLGKYGNIIPMMRDSAGFLRHLWQTYGQIVALARGTNDYVFAFGPEYNQQILSNPTLFEVGDADKAPLPLKHDTALRRIYASGLNQMNEPRHKQQRRLMMPALHKKRVEAYRDGIVALAERHLAPWQLDQTVDVLAEMRSLTAAVAVKTLLGLDPGQERESTLRAFSRFQGFFFNPLTYLLPFRLPGLPYYRLLTLAEEWEINMQAMLERKRAGGLDEGDALSMLLQTHDEDGTQMTDRELIGQTATLFVAGHETTATALTWTLLLLALHPPVLADLLAELEPVLHGAAPTIEQLARLPLLEAVIKESMRLFPPFFWQLRVAAQPVALGPYHLPAGTTIGFSSLITHRLPELYAQPDQFLPDRWARSEPGPYAYLPFSAGPRMCLGATFAMLEMRLILPLIVQRYRLALRPGVRVDRAGLVFMVPKGGLPMVVKPQDRWFGKMEVQGSIREWVELG